MTQPKGCIVPVLKRGWNQENDSDHTSVGQSALPIFLSK